MAPALPVPSLQHQNNHNNYLIGHGIQTNPISGKLYSTQKNGKPITLMELEATHKQPTRSRNSQVTRRCTARRGNDHLVKRLSWMFEYRDTRSHSTIGYNKESKSAEFNGWRHKCSLLLYSFKHMFYTEFPKYRFFSHSA